jgi:type VI secretion system protein ImpL
MFVYWVTGGLLLAYLVLVWFLPSWMHLHGSDVWVLRVGLWFLGIVAAASVIWFTLRARRNQSGQPHDAAGQSALKEIDHLVNEASRRLRTSSLGRGASLGNLPLLFLLGEAGAGKTTTVLQSALDPELLAGQVYQDQTVLPTRVANIWYSRAAVLADPAGNLVAQPNLWKRLVKLLQPGRMASAVGKGSQAPRAAIVCFECESFMRPGASEATISAARKLGTRLQEISQTLGISFPVYVLFTKADRVSFFLDYVRCFDREESSQVFGATLPIRTLGSGVYSEEETKRLANAFDELFYSLADKRTDLLSRENEAERLAGIYEFPRELRKLRNFLVQFLVELGRPSQLSTNPFLRGFYFCGARPVLIEDVVSSGPSEPVSEASSIGGATVIFSAPVRAQERPAAVRSGGSRKVPQWVFLSQLFNDVIAKDRVALTASAYSSRVSLLRRVGLILAAVVGFLAIAFFVVSFFGNRALENNVRAAVGGLQMTRSTADQPASLEDLQKLDRLRQELATLADYDRNGPPLMLRWGLYVGDRIYPDARRLYFDRFQQLLLSDTQRRMVHDLSALPEKPGPSDDYKHTYEELKAYLITTSNHDKSTTDFLPRELAEVWASGRSIEQERKNLAIRQFEYYSAVLPSDGFFSKDNDKTAVDRAQTYLDGFSGIDRYYLPLIAKAAQGNPGTSFHEKFPDAAGVVTSSHGGVSGAFTPAGFKFMDDAMRNPAVFLSGEAWVLGPKASKELDQSSLQQKLRDRYHQEFVKEWLNVLENSHVNPFSGFPDANQKLERLTGTMSPLLEVLWFVSSNTNVGDPAAKDPFASVQIVEPPGDPNRQPAALLSPANQPYIQALSDLKEKVGAIAADPAGLSNSTLMTAAIQSVQAAKTAANRPTGASLDNPFHTEDLVHKLLLEPIIKVEALLKVGSKGPLNDAGQALCSQFAQISGKYPFTAKSGEDLSFDKFNEMFAPKTGALWKFYDDNKLSQYLVKQGASYQSVSSVNLEINPAFKEFFNRAAAVTDTFFPGGSPTPKFSYTLKAMPSNVSGLALKIGNETLSGTDAQRTFVWTGVPEDLQVTASGGLGLRSERGTWAIFRFVAAGSEVSKSTTNLKWMIVQSDGKPVMINGEPGFYSYQLQVNGWNPFGASGLAGMRCEAHVAK